MNDLLNDFSFSLFRLKMKSPMKRDVLLKKHSRFKTKIVKAIMTHFQTIPFGKTHTYIYYMANWSTMKRSILIGSLSSPNFAIRTAKMDSS